MHEFSFAIDFLRVPRLGRVAQVGRVVVAAELAGEQGVGPVRQDHGAVLEALVDELHVESVHFYKPAVAAGHYAFLESVELAETRLYDHEHRSQRHRLGRVPVCARQGDGGLREEEQLVDGLQ